MCARDIGLEGLERSLVGFILVYGALHTVTDGVLTLVLPSTGDEDRLTSVLGVGRDWLHPSDVKGYVSRMRSTHSDDLVR